LALGENLLQTFLLDDDPSAGGLGHLSCQLRPVHSHGSRILEGKHSVAAGHIILVMTQEARELLQKALALPENERAELAGNLISSLDATVDQDVDAAWQQEVVRRLHEVQSGKVETVSWEKVQQKGHTLLHGK
jgi:putative addiction module component (TIGR02574 family)